MKSVAWKDDNWIKKLEEDEDYEYKFYPKFTEASLNRVMWHGKDGFIIISTSRSCVVPYIDDEHPARGYDYDSWQSLFDEYKDYCNNHELPLYDEENENKLNENSSRRFLIERNEKCDHEFWKYLKSKENPYTYTPSFGGYVSNNSTEKASKEPSFIVYNSLNKYKNTNGGWDDLYHRALEWCEKYKQDSVYIQAPGDPPIYVDKDGNKVNDRESLNFTFNQKGAYYTSVGRRVNHSKLNMNKDELEKDISTIPHTFTADIQFGESRELINTMRIRAHEPGCISEQIKWTQLGEIWDIRD